VPVWLCRIKGEVLGLLLINARCCVVGLIQLRFWFSWNCEEFKNIILNINLFVLVIIMWLRLFLWKFRSKSIV